MATTKRRAKRANREVRAAKVTSSFEEVQTFLASGADVILVVGTTKRSQVRIWPGDRTRASRIGRFGFLEYWPDGKFGRIRVFVDDEDTGVERRNVVAALAHALAAHSMSECDLAPGVSGPDAVPFMAEAVCRLVGVENY